ESRIGQGKFRDDLIILWEKRCAISEYDDVNILKASHIKPWKDSSDKEKLDRFNGLLLLPNYDELFDRGYISFDNNGKIIFSACLSDDNRKILNLPTDLRLRFICDEHRLYLEYHRNNVLIM
ncbi:MAG: HNH endonuclease, partial [Nitrospinota bacterium]